MDSALRAFIRQRAGERCEYCHVPQAASRFVRFHIEHVIARQHGGSSDAENLALACSFCNFQKGPNIAGVDPESDQIVSLFNPRRNNWGEHFFWQGSTIAGRTPIGRATVQVLAMNHWRRVELRENMRSLGEPFGD